MTYKQFLAALRKTPRTWRIMKGGEIVCRKGRCPMGALMPAEAPADAPAPNYASKHLGLSFGEADEIAAAADKTDYCSQKIRRDLLRACGLKERP